MEKHIVETKASKPHKRPKKPDTGITEKRPIDWSEGNTVAGVLILKVRTCGLVDGSCVCGRPLIKSKQAIISARSRGNLIKCHKCRRGTPGAARGRAVIRSGFTGAGQ